MASGIIEGIRGERTRRISVARSCTPTNSVAPFTLPVLIQPVAVPVKSATIQRVAEFRTALVTIWVMVAPWFAVLVARV